MHEQSAGPGHRAGENAHCASIEALGKFGTVLCAFHVGEGRAVDYGADSLPPHRFQHGFLGGDVELGNVRE